MTRFVKKRDDRTAGGEKPEASLHSNRRIIRVKTNNSDHTGVTD
jgi:hypothetical protein